MNFYIGSTKIDISYYFILMLTTFILIDSTHSAILFLFAVALHECGHLIMLILFKIKISSIKFSVYGISIVRQKQFNVSYYKEILIYSAGVINNIIAAITCNIINHTALYSFIIINIALALFNILPIGRLDGGQLVYNIACLKYEKHNVDKIFKIISFVFLIPLFALSVFVLLIDIRYISLFACMIYLSIFVFTM